MSFLILDISHVPAVVVSHMVGHHLTSAIGEVNIVMSLCCVSIPIFGMSKVKRTMVSTILAMLTTRGINTVLERVVGWGVGVHLMPMAVATFVVVGGTVVSCHSSQKNGEHQTRGGVH